MLRSGYKRRRLCRGEGLPPAKARRPELPPELWLRVFRWLSPQQLYQTVAPVCKAWRLLSRDPSLWRELSFRGPAVATGPVCRLLQHSPRLRALELVERRDAAAILRQLADSNRGLRVLVLKRCAGGPNQSIVTADVLLRLIRRCPRIEELTLKETQFRSTRFYRLLGRHLPALRKVNFGYNLHFGSSALKSIVGGCDRPLEQFVGFRSLGSHSRAPLCGDPDVALLCARMGGALAVLKLNAQALSDEALRSIAAACPGLHTLQLRCAVNITFEGIMQLLHLTRLGSLTVSVAIDICTASWCELFSRGAWGELRALSLSLCYHVEDEVLGCISRSCRQLEKLKLTGCVRATSQGLRHVLRHCGQLRHLNLVLMQREVLGALELLPQHTPRLQTLVFGPVVQEDLALERRALNDLRRRLPQLAIRIRQ